MSIGILNESPLHEALKVFYSEAGARQEVPVGSFVADVLAPDDRIFEIQTAGFAGLRRKLESVLERHRVVLVHPIAQVRYIVKLDDCPDRPVGRRRSPRRGSLAQIAEPLVSIPHLLDHPNFELEVVMIEEEELRRHSEDGPWRRKGWHIVQRRLGQVLEQHRFTCAADLFRLLRAPLPESFTTADMAQAMGEPRWLAQKLAYTLREAGQLSVCGKQGNALCYRRVNACPSAGSGC